MKRYIYFAFVLNLLSINVYSMHKQKKTSKVQKALVGLKSLPQEIQNSTSKEPQEETATLYFDTPCHGSPVDMNLEPLKPVDPLALTFFACWHHQ